MARRSICLAGVLVLCWLALNMVVLPPAAADPGALFVSATGSGTDCSQAAPCGLQTALGQALDGDTIYVAGGTYTGSGAAVVTITKSIALLGGWNGAATGPVLRDPPDDLTTLDGEGARRVVYFSGDITPTLDGFVVARGNATGLTTGYCPGNPDGCGGGIYVWQAHVVLTNNVITGNTAAVTTSGFPTATSGFGGGIHAELASNAVIAGNQILSNTGSVPGPGYGGGLYVGPGSTGIQIVDNRVAGNAATAAPSGGEGGGIAGYFGDAVIRWNTVEGNRAGTRGSGIIQFLGTAQYEANLIRGNTGAPSMWLWHGRMEFTGNRVLDNAAQGIYFEGSSSGESVLANNIIARNESYAVNAASSGAAPPVTVTLVNNTLVGTSAGTGVYGHYASITMTNNIVVSFAVGITNTTPAAAQVQPDHTLFAFNGSNGITGTIPVKGDPAFVDPAGGDFHIGPASGAIDKGSVRAGLTTDMDGEPRFGVPDVGADEYWAPGALKRVYLPVVMR